MYFEGFFWYILTNVPRIMQCKNLFIIIINRDFIWIFFSQLNILVYDNLRPHRRDTLTCSVSVSRNLNAPSLPPYAITIDDDTQPFTNILNITASDLDQNVSWFIDSLNWKDLFFVAFSFLRVVMSHFVSLYLYLFSFSLSLSQRN